MQEPLTSDGYRLNQLKTGKPLMGNPVLTPFRSCVETMDQKHVTKILSFYAMGDGSLTLHKGCRNASFHITLKACHRDLLEDLATLIEEGVGTTPRLTDARPSGHADHGKYLRLDTRVHPKFTRLYSRIYVGPYRGLD